MEQTVSTGTKALTYNPAWTFAVPLAGAAMLALAISLPGLFGLTALLSLGLAGSVIAAVHHAEVIAHRVGEPYGTLVLAMAVTVIEVALIVSLMIAAEGAAATLARDTVFAAVMIIMNGIIGISLLVGGRRHYEQGFQLQGVSAALGTLTVITVFTLVMPNYTTSVAGPVYSPQQLIFIAAATLVLFGGFTFIQTIRHRDYFLPLPDPTGAGDTDGDGEEDHHAAPPSLRTTWASVAMLMVALVTVVLSAKMISPTIKAGLAAIGAPAAMLGILIALLVLAPEGVAAVRASMKNRLQTSLNLAVGSAIATIGLTIPVVAVVSLAMGWPLTLGLDAKQTMLLVLTLFVASISLSTGRTTVLQGLVHLVLFAAFLFLSIIP